MAYGLVHTGRAIKSDALQGMEKVQQNEQQREMRNDQIEQAESTQKTASVSGGAAVGAQVGTQIMPGWGTLIGAGIGALAGWAGAEIF